MTENVFKVGDVVRRVRGGGAIGKEYTVTELHGAYRSHIGIYVDNIRCVMYEENYELVKSAEPVPPSPPTDKELADQYRASITKARAARNMLLERGFALKRGNTTIPLGSQLPIDEYIFVKTVTPAPIITTL